MIPHLFSVLYELGAYKGNQFIKKRRNHKSGDMKHFVNDVISEVFFLYHPDVNNLLNIEEKVN